MRTPHPANTPINARRRSVWRQRFGSYRFGITDAGITDWVGQFHDADKDTAARLLDSVEFISAEQVHHAFPSLLARVPGWHRSANKRRGTFAFVAFSSSAGESGDTMLHQFRLANNLNHREFDSLFIGRSDLLRSGLGRDDTVVFLDDFVGTGNQAVTAWQNMFQELTAQIGNVYLVTVGAFRIGSEREDVPSTVEKRQAVPRMIVRRSFAFRQVLCQ